MKARWIGALVCAAAVTAAVTCSNASSKKLLQRVLKQRLDSPENAGQSPDKYWMTWYNKNRSSLDAYSAGGRTIMVSPNGNDSSNGPFRTLNRAVSSANPGDTIILADGEYPGTINLRRSGEPGRPITIRAEHIAGAIINADQAGPQFLPVRKNGVSNPAPAPAAVIDGIHVNQANNIVIEGLIIRNAPRAAIRINTADNVTVRWCRCFKGGKWGIFSNFSNDTVLEYNECAYSALEHGIYLSNGGDRSIVRFNSCHDNARSGIQLNADPKFIRPQMGKRGDGIMEDCVIEGNVIYNCGSVGAAGINLASVRTSKIVNNLLFNNLAGGIAMWNDHRRDLVEYGCKNNQILHNTIYFKPGDGRYCVSVKHGSTDNIIRNNILCGGKSGAFEVDDVSSFTSDHNILWSMGKGPIVINDDTHKTFDFGAWQKEGKREAGSLSIEPPFVSHTSEPFDFHLKSSHPALRKAVAVDSHLMKDLEGSARNGGGTFGCYEAK